MKKQLIILSLVVLAWTAIFLFWGRANGSRDMWGFMMIGSGVITFFGFMTLPGSVNKKGAFQESRIRLAITTMILVLYTVYFGSVVYLTPDVDETGKVIETLEQELLPTLTQLITITLAFYFGASAAVEIADKKRSSVKNSGVKKDLSN